jgi:predicted Zn finger-like uncharacterized protein
MDVSCPACAARYTADDEKLRGKTARMRCKACNTVWLVSGAGAPTPTTTGDSPVSMPLDNAPMSKRVGMPIDNAPVSKRAAVVRRGAEREKRDLFAQRDDEVASSKHSDAPPSSLGLAGGVGARNENSVLFRVDQLSAGRLKTPEPTRAPTLDVRGPDDEGVIDLKALSSAPPRAMGMPVAPLFSEPPPVTLEVDSTTRPNARPRSRLAIVGAVFAAAAFLALSAFGLSIAFRGEEPVKRTAAVAPPPPAVVAPPPVVEPPPPVAATTDDTDAKDAKAKKTKGKGRSGARSGPITSKTPPPAAKAAPKAANPCGCNGDFNCILACTAKGGS